MLSIFAIAAVLIAQEADTGEAYRACAEVEGRRARLRCYDEAAAKDAVLLAKAAAEQADLSAAEAEPVPQVSEAAPTDDTLAEIESRAAEAERRAAEAEAALAAAEQRAKDAERRAGPERIAFDQKVDALGFGADRTLIVRLEDGSVWRQNRSDKEVDRDDLERIQHAYVTPAAMGSWRMTLEPLGQTIKVRPRAEDPRAN